MADSTIHGLATITRAVVDAANDELILWDADAATSKRVAVDNLPVPTAGRLSNDVWHAYTPANNAAVTIDFSTYAMASLTIDGTNAVTLTAPAFPSSVQIHIINGGAAAFTWVTDINWPGGTVPSWTVAGLDILTLVWNGTVWYGVAVLAMS
jgi:hypothetical protein